MWLASHCRCFCETTAAWKSAVTAVVSADCEAAMAAPAVKDATPAPIASHLKDNIGPPFG